MKDRNELGKKKVIAIVQEIIKTDNAIMGNRDLLLDALENAKNKKPELNRFIASLIAAVRYHNVNEKVYAVDMADEEVKEQTKKEILDNLTQTGMKAEKAQFVVDVFTGALRWDERKLMPIEDVDEFDDNDDDDEALDEDNEGASSQPSSSRWICVCGKENTGKFCVSCGKSMEEAQREQTSQSSVYRMSARQDSIYPAQEPIQPPNQQNDSATSSAAWEQAEYQAEANVTEEAPIQQGNVMAAANVQNEASPSATNSSESNDAGQNSKSKTFVVVGVIALIIIGAVLGAKFFSNKSDSSSTTTPTAQTTNSSTAKPRTQQKAYEPKTDLSLGGVELDMSMSGMKSVLGNENSKEKRKDGHMCYNYKDMQVIDDGNGLVGALVSDGASVKTRRGIHEGSTYQEMVDTYGKDYMVTDNGNLILYEYKFDSIGDRPGILRFAINKSNKKVNYISVRIVEKPKTDTQGAINVLKNYHRNITNKDYRKAYNLCTESMQNTLGLYNKWVGGFKNTVSSEVTDIKVVSSDPDNVTLQYTLISKDKGGYKTSTTRFRGTAAMVRTNNGWRINEVENKKM